MASCCFGSVFAPLAREVLGRSDFDITKQRTWWVEESPEIGLSRAEVDKVFEVYHQFGPSVRVLTRGGRPYLDAMKAVWAAQILEGFKWSVLTHRDEQLRGDTAFWLWGMNLYPQEQIHCVGSKYKYLMERHPDGDFVLMDDAPKVIREFPNGAPGKGMLIASDQTLDVKDIYRWTLEEALGWFNLNYLSPLAAAVERAA